MRPRAVRVFEHEVGPASQRVPARAGIATLSGRATADNVQDGPTAPAYAAAFARVQEHLHAGNSYEVNLTHRLSPPSPTSTR